MDERARRGSSREANPMIWPYFRTGSPVAIAARATLWPSPIGSRTSIVRPPRWRTAPSRDRPRRDRHVIVVPQDDRLRTLDRN